MSGSSTGKDAAAAVVTIDATAAEGALVEIAGGWATGHEAVALTETVVLVVGKGVVEYLEDDAYDDFLDDDEAEAELEESFLEEEREDLENEIESAEEDAVEALEEKRIETDGLGKEINEAEEEVVEALEDSRQNVNQALDSLKEEIVAEQKRNQQEKMAKHMHGLKERMEAQRKHREEHARKHAEGKLEEMQRRFAKKSLDVQKDKLSDLLDAKRSIVDSIGKLKRTDKKEHDRARHEHLQAVPKEKLQLDMEELKKHARERLMKVSESARVGVNELMNTPHAKEMRRQLKKGYVRGSVYNGDKGKPLPPEGRHFLIVMFTLFGLVGFVRWSLDKRRRAKKGRRAL